MRYALEFRNKQVVKQLKAIGQPDQDRILVALDDLRSDPRPTASKRLVGTKARRLRVGSYRILYEIHNSTLVILVIAIGHRSTIYKK